MELTKLKQAIAEPIPIRELVYRYLREEILRGRITPTQRLVEARVAQQIGTSRTPVREAMHLLEREGFLESVPRVGYRVKAITRQELRELRSIRFVNESLAIRWAMKRITPEEVWALEDNLHQAALAIQEGRHTDFVELAAEFHGKLSQASGSRRLYDLCQNLRHQMLRYRLQSLYRTEVCVTVNQGHERILEKIKALDEEGAVRELDEHLKLSEETVLRYAFTGKRL